MYRRKMAVGKGEWKEKREAKRNERSPRKNPMFCGKVGKLGQERPPLPPDLPPPPSSWPADHADVDVGFFCTLCLSSASILKIICLIVQNPTRKLAVVKESP
ncbi:hypothetical protein BDD12DRAFT_891213 [Trichophaea hybrida]|nr:hypothetical protein BDD12DRAFT_891213 [Trichophaea hybrida]